MADGADQFRRAGVVAELTPQATYLHVDTAIESLVTVATGEIDQLLAREHALRMFDESEQQVEFAAGQRYQRVVRRAQLAPGHVQVPAGKTDGGACAGGCCAWRGPPAEGSPGPRQAVPAGRPGSHRK